MATFAAQASCFSTSNSSIDAIWCHWPRTCFNIMVTLRSFPKGTAHLLDAVGIPLPMPIFSLLRDVFILLASGKATPSISRFLIGGSLAALNKEIKVCCPDIRPISVDESLRQLTGKCLCAALKDKASEYFEPLQLGVACSYGSETIMHGLRKCLEEHWMEDNFVVATIDMQNAFNLVSRHAGLPCWKYYAFSRALILGSGLTLFCGISMGQISSQSGMQQSDLLWPLLNSLVALAADSVGECLNLLFQAWFLDDRVSWQEVRCLAGSVTHWWVGIYPWHVHQYAKMELFSQNDISIFPASMKSCHMLIMDILGAPIGDYMILLGNKMKPGSCCPN